MPPLDPELGLADVPEVPEEPVWLPIDPEEPVWLPIDPEEPVLPVWPVEPELLELPVDDCPAVLPEPVFPVWPVELELLELPVDGCPAVLPEPVLPVWPADDPELLLVPVADWPDVPVCVVPDWVPAVLPPLLPVPWLLSGFVLLVPVPELG